MIIINKNRKTNKELLGIVNNINFYYFSLYIQILFEAMFCSRKI